MERPSHITFDSRLHCLSCRLPYVGLALFLQFATVWLFTHGLIDISKVDIFHPGPIELMPVIEPKEPPPTQPPEPNIQKNVLNERPVEPLFKWDKPAGENFFRPQQPTGNDPPKPTGPDRALAAVPGTHTVPPYPPIARRIGVEGKVTLRLTVSAEGKVMAADVVTSSGRDDMDQSARQWIMAHWAYKPALDKGVPVIGHVLATVNFNLINEH